MSKQRTWKLVIKILILITLLTSFSYKSKIANINEDVKYA